MNKINLKQILNNLINYILLVLLTIITTLVVLKETQNISFFSAAESKIISTYFRLPKAKLPVVFDGKKITKVNIPEVLSGLPIVPNYSTIITLADHKVIWLPIMYNDSNLPVQIKSRLINPLKISFANPYYDYEVGRKSLWFMPEDVWMLYAVIIDPDIHNNNIGIGFIHVKRFENTRYDILLKDEENHILIAARGQIKAINKDTGQGTLIADSDQKEVRKIYNPEWDVEPTKFVLFSE